MSVLAWFRQAVNVNEMVQSKTAVLQRTIALCFVKTALKNMFILTRDESNKLSPTARTLFNAVAL